MKKVYYKLVLKQTSPLRIGNGTNEQSDSDLMLDGRGLPFIPGTSLAGIIRHMAEDGKRNEESILNHLFGTINISTVDTKNESNSDSISSAIIVGDAVLPKGISSNDNMINRRDGIGLDDWGITIRGAKYDFQIAEVEENYVSIIEWNGDDDSYKSEIEDIIEPILSGMVADGLSVGARTSRGYGSFDVQVIKKVFVFPKDLNEWLDFNPYESDFTSGETVEGTYGETENDLEILFDMRSNFSVRVNTARTELEFDGSLPDSVPMENYKGNPVIPGTVWAGVFRHHMHDLIRDAGFDSSSEIITQIDELFGMLKGKNEHRKSSIRFSESEIDIADKKIQKMSVVRTAIDRFTSSPRNTALFTDMIYSGGTGTLHISYKKNTLSKEFLELLAACLCDMHLGLISVGGASSVGRGIMRINNLSFNGKDITDKLIASIENGESLDWIKEENDNA